MTSKEREREERILKAWCVEEGFDYESLSDEEKTNYWFRADEWHEEQCFDNSQFGLGA